MQIGISLLLYLQLILNCLQIRKLKLSSYSIIITLLLFGFQYSLKAQILDDSTKQIYGTKTITYILEKDLFENTGKVHYLDTLMDNFHRYDAVRANDYLYQDLGNFASAIRPLFYNPPTTIGTQIGINTFEPYLFDVDNIKYYDTKSPFTAAHYIQGNRGDQYIDFIFTRGIKDLFNFGIEYNRINTARQFAQTSRNPDNVVDMHLFVLHSRFQTRSQKYKALFHYSHLNSRGFDTGGIRVTGPEEFSQVFDYALEEANLADVTTWQTQNNFRLYHEFALADEFQIFHVFDRKRQRDDYNDLSNSNTEANALFYQSFQDDARVDQYHFRQDTTSEGIKYRQMENMAGVKGRIGKFYFQGYYKLRQLNFSNSYEGQEYREFRIDTTLSPLGEDSTFTTPSDSTIIGSNFQEIENFLGGKLYYEFSENALLFAQIEYLLGEEDFMFLGELKLKNFTVGLHSVSQSPSIIENRWVSNHFFWSNNFRNTFSQKLYGEANFNFGKLHLNPLFSYQVVSNYIYFNSLARPEQTNQTIQIVQAGLQFSYQFWKFTTRNEIRYTLNLDADLIRFPELFTTFQLYCEDCFLSNFINSQIGVDFHLKSNYFADGYMPVTKQFHLQDDFLVEAYPIIDVFINFRFRNVRLFFKYNHINFSPGNGYITTPIYTGMPGQFTMGVDWLFFD